MAITLGGAEATGPRKTTCLLPVLNYLFLAIAEADYLS